MTVCDGCLRLHVIDEDKRRQQHHEANFTCKTSVTRKMPLEAFFPSRTRRNLLTYLVAVVVSGCCAKTGGKVKRKKKYSQQMKKEQNKWKRCVHLDFSYINERYTGACMGMIVYVCARVSLALLYESSGLMAVYVSPERFSVAKQHTHCGCVCASVVHGSRWNITIDGLIEFSLILNATESNIPIRSKNTQTISTWFDSSHRLLTAYQSMWEKKKKEKTSNDRRRTETIRNKMLMDGVTFDGGFGWVLKLKRRALFGILFFSPV